MHVLIVSFDGLRPDLISQHLTPNLFRLRNEGTFLSKQRTVYPSETRVAFPSLVTGATASGHGMVGNKYVDRASKPSRYIDTADADLLLELDRESGGQLMSAQTLGEILARAGKSLAVLSTNTPGTTRLFHHKAENFGHFRLSGHFPEACTPAQAVKEITDRFGPLPPETPKGEPDLEGQTFITTVFLEHVLPNVCPDVAIVSYGEPDTASHFNGTAGKNTLKAIEHCDAEFGRILEWWDAEGKAAGVQLVILSDHGHITAHTRVSVIDRLRTAGYAPAPAPAPGVDVVVVPGQVGALYVADYSVTKVSRLCEALMDQEWVGSIFTSARNELDGVAPGTFANSLVFADHLRAPDVYFTFRADDSLDPFGLVGGTYYDNNRAPGLGVHGGLHEKELASVGILAGTAFQQGKVSSVPSSICDIAPTILRLLSLPVPDGMTGRCLDEVFAEGADQVQNLSVEKPQILETGLHQYTQRLQRSSVGSTVYLDGGTGGNSAASRKNPEVAA